MKEQEQIELEMRVLRAKQAGLSERIGRVHSEIAALEKRLAELEGERVLPDRELL